MAVDNRPFKSKEQDGQGNEVIIRDQQLVEQGTTTTMPAGTYFQTLDVDGRPVKISKDNMLNLIVEGLGIIFNGQSDQQTVTKVPTLNGNNFGASTVATLASVLGVRKITTLTVGIVSGQSKTVKYTPIGRGVSLITIYITGTGSEGYTLLSQFYKNQYAYNVTKINEYIWNGYSITVSQDTDGEMSFNITCIGTDRTVDTADIAELQLESI